MTARLLDGKSVALQIREEVKDNARNLIEKGVVPGLAAVLVGDNPASQLYVNSKAKACQEAGLFSEVINMSNDTNNTVLAKKLDLLNDRADFDGILLQLPLLSCRVDQGVFPLDKKLIYPCLLLTKHLI